MDISRRWLAALSFAGLFAACSASSSLKPSDGAAGSSGGASGGSTAGGGSGGSKTDQCESISAEYATAVQNSEECTLGAPQQCTRVAAASFFCRCEVFVNGSLDTLAGIDQRFTAAGCQSGCFGSCDTLRATSCQPDSTSSTGARCVHAQPDGGPDASACCAIETPSCDCFGLGGARVGGVCPRICDAAPVNWVMSSDASGCPILVQNPVVGGSCLSGPPDARAD
jgi:hypothetical protein